MYILLQNVTVLRNCHSSVKLFTIVVKAPASTILIFCYNIDCCNVLLVYFVFYDFFHRASAEVHAEPKGNGTKSKSSKLRMFDEVTER